MHLLFSYIFHSFFLFHLLIVYPDLPDWDDTSRLPRPPPAHLLDRPALQRAGGGHPASASSSPGLLNVYLSVGDLYVRLYVCHSISRSVILLNLCQSLCLFVCLFCCPSLLLSISLSVCLFVCLSLCLSVSMFVFLTVSVSVYWSVYLDLKNSIGTSFYLSV